MRAAAPRAVQRYFGHGQIQVLDRYHIGAEPFPHAYQSHVVVHAALNSVHTRE